MNLSKYKYVPTAILSTIIFSLLNVLLSYSLSLLVVQNQNQLFRNFLIVFSVYILHSLALFWNLKTKSRASNHLQTCLAQQLDLHITEINYNKFRKKDYGHYLSIYINDIPKILELTFEKYTSRLQMATTAIASFIALIQIHYSLGIVSVVAMLAMSLIPKLFQTKLRLYISGLQAEKAVYTSKLRELLQGYTTFFENLAFPIFLRKSYTATQTYTHYQFKTQTFTAGMSSCLTFINGFVSALSVTYVSYLVLQNQVKIGALLAVLSLIPSFGNSIIQFLSEGEFYKSGLALFDEKLSFAKGKYNLDKPAQKLNEPDPQYNLSLTLKNITIPFDTPLSFPNLTFLPNRRYAIIGESGSGKSTLLKVLVGEITNYSGEVLVNGSPKKPEEHLFHLVSYMNQETFLFNDSIRNNIDLLGKLTDSEIEQLLEDVGLASFSPQMLIEDNGNNLSGGQRQRLSFARALARQKEILILDEATANLDSQTTQIIEQLALDSAKTLIMITHHKPTELPLSIDNIITIRSSHETHR